MEFARPGFDFGLYTNRLAPMLAFWQGEVGARFEGENPMGPGRIQHRHGLQGSILKINHYEEPLAAAPASGFVELVCASQDVAALRTLSDPDGNRVALVPAGLHGVEALAVRVASPEPDRLRGFYAEAFGLAPTAAGIQVGPDLILFEASHRPAQPSPMNGPGYRYLTFHVADCAAAHAVALAAGAMEGAPVRTFGERVRFSLLCDPDGNWIELAQAL